MKRTSRDEQLVLAPLEPGVRFIRAGTAQAAPVTAFLLAQDVRPAPSVGDVSAFVGSRSNTVFLAVRGECIIGCAACTQEGLTCMLTYLAFDRQSASQVAGPLLAMVEDEARDAGCAVIMAQVVAGSATFEHLSARRFAATWSEHEVVGGRLTDLVDLVKPVYPDPSN